VVVSPAEKNITEPQSDTWTMTPFQNSKKTKRVYKKMKDTDNSCPRNDDTNEKKKPVGDNLPRHFDKTLASTSSAETPKTERSEVVEDRIVKIGAERAAREEEQARRRLGVPIPTAENARQIVLDAARKDPISDLHMEILLRATLPKKPIFPGSETVKPRRLVFR
ncbi:MAG: hypothetical protein ACK559_36865, partial [bacterium]